MVEECIYVYEPKKTKPKSQKHGEHFYGPFDTVEDATRWKEYKGVMGFDVIKTHRRLNGSNVHDVADTVSQEGGE